MKNLAELKELVSKENIIFIDQQDSNCKTAIKLFKKLQKLDLIQDWAILNLENDFNYQVLKELVIDFGWDGLSEFPILPQIFVNQREKTEYISGTEAFYKSDWNLGENSDCEITIKGKIYKAPNLKS